MIEMTPQMRELIESMYAWLGDSTLEKVKREPEVYTMSVLLLMNEFLHTRQGNYDIIWLLQRACFADRLQAAREFLAREHEAASIP